MGRTVADTAHEVRVGKITRDEGVLLVKKFDGEFPKKYFKEFLEYVSLSESEFEEVVDSWRSDHIWKRENGTWKLRFPISENPPIQGENTILAAKFI